MSKAITLKLDVIFIVDVTGSMGGLIKNAREILGTSLQKLENTGVDLTVSLCLYRDHPPQDRTFASFVAVNCGTSADVHTFIHTSSKFTADGGGDTPESGLDAIKDISKLALRNGAIHEAFLIGDAPLHGTPYNSDMQKCLQPCVCGLTYKDIPIILEEHNVRLTGIALNTYPSTIQSFSSVCSTVFTSKSKDIFYVFDYLGKLLCSIRWSVDVLLPVLQESPYISISELSKSLNKSTSNIAQGIELLNLLELTSEFN